MMFRENFSICNFDTFMLPGPPEAPTISGLPSISLREGDNLVLTCISRHGSPLPTLKWFRCSPSCYCIYSVSILFLLTRQGEYIENQNFTRQDSDQSVAKLFLVVSRADNHVQYSCEASNGDHFPSVSQKTNFSVNARRIFRRGTHCTWQLNMELWTPMYAWNRLYPNIPHAYGILHLIVNIRET